MAKIAAFVTTFNRLELLKKVIAGLRSQTRQPDFLTVINNSSTDETLSWLKENNINHITQPNVGSSGGQWRAIHEGLKTDADYIWIMDDDVVARPDCLEKMLSVATDNRIVAPLRYTSEGKIFENEPITLNLTTPHKSIWGKIISPGYLQGKKFAPAEGLTFEGPLIPRKIALRIGKPEFDFFIHADDTEYMVRAKKAGFELGLATEAFLDRMLPVPDINAEFSWKHYYVIRNIIAIDRLHGSFLVKYLRPFAYLQAWIRRSNNKNDISTTWKAFRDGYNYKKATEIDIHTKLGIE